MAKVSKTIVDKKLRENVFSDIFEDNTNELVELGFHAYHKINDRQYGTIMTDENGERRYVRIGVIVAELREDMTAEELMQNEINAYNTKQEEKAIKAKQKAEKIAKDKKKREEEAEDEGPQYLPHEITV